MAFDDKTQREVFHFLFLDRLLKISDPKFYVLKGGVNFRFFLQSPRYSEDMDLDVVGGAVETLKKNGYKILEDAAFQRNLQSFGIRSLKINDKEKAKHTETTQRFSLRLVNDAGEEFPTKVEFSRRAPDAQEKYLLEDINPAVALTFKRLSYRCYHYTPEAALLQKIRALAFRKETQARDVFDMYLLYLAGYFTAENLEKVDESECIKAKEALSNLSYEHYRGQVVEYLQPEARARFESEKSWNEMISKIEEGLDE